MNAPHEDPGDATRGPGRQDPTDASDAAAGRGSGSRGETGAAAFERPDSPWAGATSELAEKNQGLWLLAASPTIWAVHFLLSYITGAVWCAKVVGRAGSLGAARGLVGAYTVVALVGIGVVTWRAWRRHRYGTATVPHDFDTPEDRTRFLGFSALLLSALSAVAVIYVALVVVFTETCR